MWGVYLIYSGWLSWTEPSVLVKTVSLSGPLFRPYIFTDVQRDMTLYRLIYLLGGLPSVPVV